MNELLSNYISRKEVFVELFDSFFSDLDIESYKFKKVEIDDSYIERLYDLQKVGVAIYSDCNRVYLLFGLAEQIDNMPSICFEYHNLLLGQQMQYGKNAKEVVCLTAYFGDDKWRKPDSLEVKIDTANIANKSYLFKYKINILQKGNIKKRQVNGEKDLWFVCLIKESDR